jgi:predicted 2-oxoglutarate/Fe(II)-dependent dioxygenase YbiX
MWFLQGHDNHPFAYIKDFVTARECQDIILLGEAETMEASVVNLDHHDQKSVVDTVRQCRNSWIKPSDTTEWLFRRLVDGINHINREYFVFDLTGLEDLQFTEYQADNQDHYGSHCDQGYKTNQNRKLSVSLQLSDPDLYRGGDLEFFTSEHGQPAPRQLGTLIVFPSYQLHRVKPVTFGTRFSLVTWVVGPRFR